MEINLEQTQTRSWEANISSVIQEIHGFIESECLFPYVKASLLSPYTAQHKYIYYLLSYNFNFHFKIILQSKSRSH
jgi:hypothetical protein